MGTNARFVPPGIFAERIVANNTDNGRRTPRPKDYRTRSHKKGYDIATYGDSINTAFLNSKTRRGRVGHCVAQTLTTSDAQQVVVEPMAQSRQNSADDELDSYRFYHQAIETLQENDCEPGDTIDAYNKRVNKDGVSPAITTRPDGFKTAILPVVTDNEENVVWNNDLGCFVDARTGEMIVGVHERPKPQKPNCRIRKLTPRECFRLMGVKREGYEAAAKHQSPSSQYHLAGDSIVTACLMAILGELLTIDYNTKITELTEGLLDADETNS